MERPEALKRIDELTEIRSKRLELDRESKKLKEQETTLEAFVIQEMDKLGCTELATGTTIVRIKKTTEPLISDWSALAAYIREHDAVDLLQKRLTVSAVRLRWEDAIKIPGVDAYETTKLSITGA